MEEPLYLPIHQQPMGEDLKQKFRGIAVYGAQDEELFDSASIPGDSDDDTVSSSSLDLTEDEVSSPTKPSSTSSSSSSSLSSQLDSKGPLFELSSLMAQLPIKRGLSKYYGGKAQSFTSLANARSIEDLPKKERRKMKPCKSYAGGLDACQKQLYAPGASSKTISKKASRGGSCTSLVARKSSTGLLCSSKPRLTPVHRNMLHALIKHTNETQ